MKNVQLTFWMSLISVQTTSRKKNLPSLCFASRTSIITTNPTWMSRTGSDRINGDRINGLFHLLINGIYWDFFNPLILAFDPTWDIQESHMPDKAKEQIRSTKVRQ